MSIQKPPAQVKALPLTDPHHVMEVFANDLAGIQIRDGICHYTFTMVRPKHGMPGITMNDPDVEHTVSVRLAVPVAVGAKAAQMFMHLESMAKNQQVEPPKVN